MTSRQTQTTRRTPAATLLVGLSALYRLVRFASWADGERETAAPALRPDDESSRHEERPASAAPREAPATPAVPAEAPPSNSRRSASATGSSRRRLGGAIAFTTLFFAGAALSAMAGDTVSSPPASGQAAGTACGEPAAAPVEEDSPAGACETGETETGETTPAEEPEPDAPPAETDTPPAATEPEPEPEGPEPLPVDGGEPSAPQPPAGPDEHTEKTSKGGTRRDGPPLVDTARPPAPRTLDPEANGDGAVVWLHRILPDPTPPARRLAPGFARELRTVAGRHDVPWSLVLAVVRANGRNGRVPIGPQALARIAASLAEQRDALGAYRPWHMALRYSGRTAFADRALALERYNRAVGLRALVTGLAAAKRTLAARILADDGIRIYAGGRADIAAGRTDVRVLVLLRYLRIAHGSVTISSLTSGHRVYSRPGVVSAHTYGLAVDVSALGGRPIAGNQQPHGVTERAVRDILLLPAELAPQQVISLLGLGGASFPLADHADHIHVGY